MEANIQPSTNEIKTKKNSFIPRLSKKVDSPNLASVHTEYQEENLLIKNSAERACENYQATDNCLCSNCFNKAKNLCRFTLNQNLISSYQKSDAEDMMERRSNADTDDDVTSVTVADNLREDQQLDEEQVSWDDTQRNYKRYGNGSDPAENIGESVPDPKRAWDAPIFPSRHKFVNSYGESNEPTPCTRRSGKLNMLHTTQSNMLEAHRFYNIPSRPVDVINNNGLNENMPHHVGVSKSLVQINSNSLKAVNQFSAQTNTPSTVSTVHYHHIPSSVPPALASTGHFGYYTQYPEHQSFVHKAHAEHVPRPNATKSSTHDTVGGPTARQSKHDVQPDVSSDAPDRGQSNVDNSRLSKFSDIDVQNLVQKYEPSNQLQVGHANNSQNVYELIRKPKSRPEQLEKSTVLTDMLKNGSFWKENIFGVHNDAGKPHTQLDTFAMNPTEKNRESLVSALLEIFGNDSHITEKIRSNQPKHDARFRSVRSKLTDASSTITEENVSKKTDSKENCDSAQSENVTDVFRNDDAFSTVSLSSNTERSIPETFMSAIQFTDYEHLKQSAGKYRKHKTSFSVKRCTCSNTNCLQLDEIHDSITNIQSEIKVLLANIPPSITDGGLNVTQEICNIKKLYEECMELDRKRNGQQKKIEIELKQIYQKIDLLVEAKRGSCFFKYFILFPILGFLTLYTVTCCLGECRKKLV